MYDDDTLKAAVYRGETRCATCKLQHTAVISYYVRPRREREVDCFGLCMNVESMQRQRTTLLKNENEMWSYELPPQCYNLDAPPQ